MNDSRFCLDADDLLLGDEVVSESIQSFLGAPILSPLGVSRLGLPA